MTVGVAVIVGVIGRCRLIVIVGVEVIVGPVAVGVGVAAIGASRTACAVKTGIELGKLAFAVNVGEASPCGGAGRSPSARVNPSLLEALFAREIIAAGSVMTGARWFCVP